MPKTPSKRDGERDRRDLAVPSPPPDPLLLAESSDDVLARVEELEALEAQAAFQNERFHLVVVQPILKGSLRLAPLGPFHDVEGAWGLVTPGELSEGMRAGPGHLVKDETRQRAGAGGVRRGGNWTLCESSLTKERPFGPVVLSMAGLHIQAQIRPSDPPSPPQGGAKYSVPAPASTKVIPA